MIENLKRMKVWKIESVDDRKLEKNESVEEKKQRKNMQDCDHHRRNGGKEA